MRWIQHQSRYILTLTVQEKNGKQAIWKSRGGWNTKIHAVTAGSTRVVGFLLSGWNVPNAQAGRLLMETLGKQETTINLLMDRAYEDNTTRLTAWGLKFNSVVPPKSNRKKSWEYDRELYKRWNEVERFFRRLKAYRGIGTRYDKLALMFTAFIWLACICILLRSVNMP
jgi:transposase